MAQDDNDNPRSLPDKAPAETTRVANALARAVAALDEFQAAYLALKAKVSYRELEQWTGWCRGTAARAGKPKVFTDCLRRALAAVEAHAEPPARDLIAEAIAHAAAQARPSQSPQPRRP